MSDNITSVSYGKTFNLGNYENEKYHATTTVTEGETPEQAVERVRAFVERQHTASSEVRGLENRASEAEMRLSSAISRLTEAQRRHTQIADMYTTLRDQLVSLGVEEARLPRLETWSGKPLSDEAFNSLIAHLRGEQPTTSDAADEDEEDEDEDEEASE